MTYTKPELAVLGDATSVIQGQKGTAPHESALFPNKKVIVSAYDLDE